MIYHRKVKFEYYQLFIRKEGEDKYELFDLTEWMDFVKNISLEKRSKDYNGERARLEEDPDFNYFFLHFVRLRATNIPSKAKIDTVVEPFELDDDEYLGEEVSALYDENKSILMLQRNKFSLGPSGIQEYVNLMWPEEDEIELRAIPIPNSFDLAKKPKIYRKLNLRLADIDKKVSPSILEGFKSPIKNFVSTYGEYEGINAQILITVGTQKDSELNEQAMRETIDDIENNKDLFSKAEISIRDHDSAPVETIDLFDGQAHDFSTFRLETRGTLSHYAVAEAMYMLYHPEKRNRQADIKSYLR